MWLSSDGSDESVCLIFRYDRLVDEYVSLNSVSALQRMNTEFPAATRILIEDVLSIGSVEDTRIEQRLRRFYLDSTLQVLLQDVHEAYPDLRCEEKELFAVFDKVKEADELFCVPFVYTQVSGLNESIVVSDSLLGISLDKYLGEDYALYQKYYPAYQRLEMNRSDIVPDALFFYLSHSYPLPDESLRSLSEVLCFYGKLHCIIARLRGISVAEEIGMNDVDVAWFEEHKDSVLSRIVASSVLESTDSEFIHWFFGQTDDGSYFGDDAPAGVGAWLGVWIAERFLSKHPQMDLKSLLRFCDYGDMLSQVVGVDVGF